MKGTKDLSTNKGITLIALVITIIVMLILVAVTISMAVNGGLFSKAGEATGKTKNALNAEQELANGIIQVGGKWYASVDDYLKGKELVFKYNEAEKDANGMLTVEAVYEDEDYIAIIPKGFAVSNKASEQTIENGLVITDKIDAEGNSIGNEYVWIPVEKAIVTEAEIAKIKEDNASITTDVAAIQKMVTDGTYPMARQEGTNYKGILYSFSGTDTLTLTVQDWTDQYTRYLEPASLTDYDSQAKFTTYGLGTYSDTLYQEAYNKMVESVDENGGFYVARYEMSSGTYTLADGSTVTYAQSKKNQQAVNKTWYEHYKYGRDYAKYNTNLGVTSEMIWGSQWDQIMLFVNGKYDGKATPTRFYVTQDRAQGEDMSSGTTGQCLWDLVANIYDLASNPTERTQASGWVLVGGRTWYTGRMLSGSPYGSGVAANRHDSPLEPEEAQGPFGSRTTLYIK